MKHVVLAIAAVAMFANSPGVAAEKPAPRQQSDVIAIPNPILFVGQVPVPEDFATVASTFGNQNGHQSSASRGGDLFILYPSGTLKNVTRAAGYGNSGFQGAGSIAVREPSVHWSGTKAIFSMVIGSATSQYQVTTHRWQMYEVTNLGENQTPVITKVANQPATFNNVSPLYGTDGRIIFTSDRPRTGEAHLYPQLDEYEEASTVTGIWSLNPISNDLRLLNHTPSGAFTPSIDSFGRLIFTRWDHLQRDQQADADTVTPGSYGTFDFSNETAAAAKLSQRVEVFPEPRAAALPPGTNLTGNSINHFFPWAINEDGTSEETLNHIGRHELHNYFDRSFNDDPALTEFSPGIRFNTNQADNLFQLRESPSQAGLYFAVDAPEFESHSSGQLLSFLSPPAQNPDQIQINWITPRATKFAQFPPASADHTGHYRDPLPLADGALLAVHTAETRDDVNTGTRANPQSLYDFRIKPLTLQSGYYVPGTPLTAGIQATVSWWDPDVMVQWSGTLWELSPVEIRTRTIPGTMTTPIEAPELAAFTQANVDVQQFRQYLAENDLALMVVRDATTRDRADKQQPFNLRVPGGVSHIVNAAQKIYDVARMQLYQADQLRGLGSTPDPNNPALVTGGRPGRRVLARNMHDPVALAANDAATVTAQGSVQLGLDGSIAAFVPARRAMTWQLTDANHTGVVRERYWITFQPGEVRVCGSCHGANTKTQVNQDAPVNTPAALTGLLQYWKTTRAAVPAPPANVVASATSLTAIALSWTASAGATGATQYEIARASAGSAFAMIATTSGTTFNDSVTVGNAFAYKVRASDAPGKSNYSIPDVATTIPFTDDPVVPQSTFIKAVHLAELRQAVNAVRAASGLPAAIFTDPTVSPGGMIKAAHFQELRIALNQARVLLGLSAITYTDATLSSGTTSVRAVHIGDLRSGVK